MLFIRSKSMGFLKYIYVLIVGGLLTIPTLLSAEGISPNKTTGVEQNHEESQRGTGHRSIEGIVEEINENTIRVNAGDAGDLSPRYLNFRKNIGDEEINLGDTVQIEVNAQNEVVRYQKVKRSGKVNAKKTM